MFTPKLPPEPSELDEAITKALKQLDNVQAFSDEYIKGVSQIEKLYALKTVNRRQRISPDTMAIVLGNLLGIVLIVGYERANVLSSAAKTFVLKAAR